ncbi:hypothetical protein ABIA39_001059 [Nocardia sp. GAS34]|uniref:DUF4351 domain-containing protein n=1 Tax=unclassified Nocardia TaxID=2637762 RepID=UPI003D25DAD6
MTTAEMLEARGEARGEASMLLKMLAQRFGPLSEAVEQKVRAATIERLDVWVGRVLTGSSVDEVLA